MTTANNCYYCTSLNSDFIGVSDHISSIQGRNETSERTQQQRLLKTCGQHFSKVCYWCSRYQFVKANIPSWRRTNMSLQSTTRFALIHFPSDLTQRWLDTWPIFCVSFLERGLLQPFIGADAWLYRFHVQCSLLPMLGYLRDHKIPDASCTHKSGDWIKKVLGWLGSGPSEGSNGRKWSGDPLTHAFPIIPGLACRRIFLIGPISQSLQHLQHILKGTAAEFVK